MQPRSSNAVITRQLIHRNVGPDADANTSAYADSDTDIDTDIYKDKDADTVVASDPNYCRVDDENSNQIICAMQDASQPEGAILWVKGSANDKAVISFYNSIMKCVKFDPVVDRRENPARKLLLSCTEGTVYHDPTTPSLNLGQGRCLEKNCGENHHTPVFFEYVMKGTVPFIVLVFLLMVYFNGCRFGGGPEPKSKSELESDEPKPANGGDTDANSSSNRLAATSTDEEQGEQEEFVNQHPAPPPSYGSVNATAIQPMSGASTLGEEQRTTGAGFFSSAYQQLRDACCVPGFRRSGP